MGNLYRWCAGCLLAFVFVTLPFFSYAETIPATSAGKYWYSAQYCSQAPSRPACDSTTKDSWDTATQDAYTKKVAGVAWTVTSKSPASEPTGTSVTVTWAATRVSDGFQGQLVLGVFVAGAQRYTCPSGQGWTLSGTTCTRPDCGPGEFLDLTQGAVCKKDCSAKQGIPAPNGYYSTSTETWTGSVSGCQVQCSKLTALVISSSTAAIMQNCSYTGKTAQGGDPNLAAESPPDPNKPKSPKDCAASGMGYILGSNGTATCVPASDAPEGQKPKIKDKDSKESGPDANGDGKPDTNSPDYKKVDTETIKDGDKVTTKKTETVNGALDGSGGVTCPSGYTKNADNTTCSKVTATTENTNSYCQDNPNSDQCKGAQKSTFGGNCDSGFTCEGDAATCASAKASWDLACTFKKTSATSDLGQQMIDGQDGGQYPGPSHPDSTQNVADLHYTDTGGSCLPDFQFNMLGRSLVIPTQGICNVGGWLGNIGVALSLLIAGFIIIGGIKAT